MFWKIIEETIHHWNVYVKKCATISPSSSYKIIHFALVWKFSSSVGRCFMSLLVFDKSVWQVFSLTISSFSTDLFFVAQCQTSFKLWFIVDLRFFENNDTFNKLLILATGRSASDAKNALPNYLSPMKSPFQGLLLWALLQMCHFPLDIHALDVT